MQLQTEQQYTESELRQHEARGPTRSQVVTDGRRQKAISHPPACLCETHQYMSSQCWEISDMMQRGMNIKH